MKPFNRERFLFYLLGAVLAVNALFFGYGIILCSRSDDPVATCPNLGARFDNYSEKALAAVLGLIAGAAAASSTKKNPEDKPPGPFAPPIGPSKPPSTPGARTK